MKTEVLRKYEKIKHLKLVLENGFVYTDISFKINEDNLVEFVDRSGDTITIEPYFIMLVSEIKSGEENEFK